MTRLSMWRVLPVMLALFVLIGPVSLQALTTEPPTTFTFSGICTDCSGTATATLTLQYYTQGNDIFDYNLISFHYLGTNLVPAFTIDSSDQFTIGGMIPKSLPAFADFTISDGVHEFESSDDGRWQADLPAADYGRDGLWNGASGVPEPGAFLLVAAGMALIGLRRWKVRN